MVHRIAYYGPAVYTCTTVIMLLAFVKPLLESNDVYGIRADFILSLGTGGILTFLLLLTNGLESSIGGDLGQLWIIVFPGIPWVLSGAIWPIAQSYGIEPMNIFRSTKRSENFRTTEENLLSMLADPIRCQALDNIAIRDFTTENIIFLKAYLSHCRLLSIDVAIKLKILP